MPGFSIRNSTGTGSCSVTDWTGPMHPKVSVAYFITSHGFGHAARASAVMQAMHRNWPFAHFHIFGNTPEWFFKDASDVSFTWHRRQTDVGMVQASALKFDLPETMEALARFFPLDENHIAALAKQVRDCDCRLVISDISPLGLAVGKKAGIPTVLIENFTWDWIYKPLATDEPRLETTIEYLDTLFKTADCRIQVEPVCRPLKEALKVPPVCRKPETPREDTRKRLGIDPERQMVLITMGGTGEDHRFIHRLQQLGNRVHFIVPGSRPELSRKGETDGNVTLLPHRSDYYHPDLVHAADAVVGKAGYSTVAEVYDAGVPFGYVVNPEFAESDVLAEFIDSEMQGLQIAGEDFVSGRWLERLPEILALPKVSRNGEANGADAIAAHLCQWVTQMDELLEIINADGLTIGAAPRCHIHGRNEWLHRVVHVLVFDRKNRLLLQKRAMTKRVAAGRWDTSVGGHVDCGETINEAVLRETGEELGFCPESLQFAYSYTHSNEFESELVHTFVCHYDGPIRFNPEEIDAVRFWEPEEIKQRLGKKIFSDNFEDEFRRYCRWSECAK